MENVPGIETANYEVVAVEHTMDALVELFTGAKVVCNTVGPFTRFGTLVVEAALKAGCHYIDTTGEQAWMLKMRDTFGDAYAEKGLVLAPACAYMFALSNLAAEFCLQAAPNVDSLDLTTTPTGIPTVGSTRTLMDTARVEQRWLANGELYVLEKPMDMKAELIVAGFNHTVLALPWGGGGVPLWYAKDSRVTNVKSHTGFSDRSIVEKVSEMGKYYEENIKHLPNDEQEAALDAIADSVTPGMPPRENRNIHRTVDTCQGTGNNVQCKVTITSTCAYLQTGLIQGFIARHLARGTPNNVGFQSPVGVVGHKELFAALQNYGFANMKIETI